MEAEKEKATNDYVSRLIQRQLMLLDFQEQENELGHRTWPTVPGISLDKSRRLFEILERWGWIAGSPFPPDHFKCIITSQGVEQLARIKAGQPLTSAPDLNIVDDDHRILDKITSDPWLPNSADAGRAFLQKIWSWTYQQYNSRPCLWLILCLGIVLLLAGTQLGLSEGLMFKSRGTALVALGAVLTVGSLRKGFRSIERRYPALSWLPAGLTLLLFIPIAWFLFNDTLEPWFAVCILAGVSVAGIPLPGFIRKSLLCSGS